MVYYLATRTLNMGTDLMKITDNYKIKLRMWATDNRVVSLPKAIGCPAFGCKRFSSGEEMNIWKKELLAETARMGGVQWTK